MITPAARHMLSVLGLRVVHYLASWLDQRHDLAAPTKVALLCELVRVCDFVTVNSLVIEHAE